MHVSTNRLTFLTFPFEIDLNANNASSDICLIFGEKVQSYANLSWRWPQSTPQVDAPLWTTFNLIDIESRFFLSAQRQKWA